jgi:uncharacterized protein (TIGR00369 family)
MAMNKDLQLTLAQNTPFYRHLGIKVVELGEGFAKLSIDFSDHLTHPLGYFHGGAITSLADSAGFNAALTLLENDDRMLTLELKINFFTPMKDEILYAEGRVIHKGRKIAVSDVEVKSTGGALVAKALVTCAIL